MKRVDYTADEQRDLAIDCINAWLPLTEEEETEFQRLISEMPVEEQEAIKAMVAGWEERKKAGHKRPLEQADE